MASCCMGMHRRLVVISFLVALVRLRVLLSSFCVMLSGFFVMIVFHTLKLLVPSVRSTIMPFRELL